MAQGRRRWNIQNTVYAILVLASSVTPTWALDSPPVTTEVHSSWPAPHPILEALELVAERNRSAYFLAVSAVAKNPPHPNASEEAYNYIYDLLTDENLNPPRTSSYLPLHKVALSLHTQSAAVQAYYHLYQSIVEASFVNTDGFRSDCASWVDVGGRQACTVNELDKIVGSRPDVITSTPLTYPFDHILGQSSLPHVILYGDIISPDFLDLHTRMLSLSSEGRFAYVLRYRPPPGHHAQEPLVLSGYGVELAIKKTDYKVIDDRKIISDILDETDDPLAISMAEGGDVLGFKEVPQIVQIDDESSLADLGLKATQFILQHPTPLAALEQLTGNFPKLAHIIAKLPVNETLRQEITVHPAPQGRQPAGAWNALEMNGVELDPVSIDPYQLLRVMRTEAETIESIARFSFSAREAIQILNTPMPLYSNQKGGGDQSRFPWGDSFDTRADSLPLWWNDLEKDRRYAQWPKHIRELKRFSFPGQLRYIRKNVFSCIMVLDMTQGFSLDAMDQVFNFIRGEVPIRFGFVPAVDVDLKGEASDMAKMIKLIVDEYGLKDARDFILSVRQAVRDSKPPVSTLTRAKPLFSTFVASRKAKNRTAVDLSRPVEELLGSLDNSIGEIRDYMQRLGVSKTEGIAFCNGRPVIMDDVWSQSIVEVYFQQIDFLVRQVHDETVDDNTDIFDFFATLPGVHPRRNPYVFLSSETVRIVHTDQMPAHSIVYIAKGGQVRLCYVLEQDRFDHISPADPSATYLASMWVLSDFSDESGVNLLREALHCIDDESVTARVGVLISSHFNSTQAEVLRKYLLAMRDTADGGTVALADAVLMLAAFFENPELATLPTEELRLKNKKSDITSFLLKNELPLHDVNAIIINGRVFGPFLKGEFLTSSDLGLAVSIDLRDRIYPMSKRIIELFNEKSFKSSGAEVKDRISPNAFQLLTIWVGNLNTALFFFSAILDPLTPDSQKISAILRQFSELENELVHISVRLEPSFRTTEVPLKRFYRYVFNSQIGYSQSGRILSPSALFRGLPENTLLTLGLDAPERWLVTPIVSMHDLDNIKLANLDSSSRKRGIESVFELKAILIEGHSRDATTNSPPRGAQLVLGTAFQPHIVDTMIMANLGYFQLKANPGVWNLRLRDGRSTKVYTMELVSNEARQLMARPKSEENPRTQLAGYHGSVVVRSLEGATLYVRLSKRPGMEMEDVLAEDKDRELSGSKQKKGGILESIANLFKRPVEMPVVTKRSTIHVFSVASGQLYERFMSIMFAGVMRHTKSPVKFWLIENFLSPSFKNFLPVLSRKYGFDYELVTYKWPYWLRKQTEKQRTIWGYKILFLDVLFPLSLERVIFVDADQIVRTDLQELMDMDIRNAAYAFTPMGDSRKETEGFRFWKTGYWANHLHGRPYHISALYLVDLVRFRQTAAGDILRSQYQMLSADPESLANLDQDLPNNLQDQIPIYSLPQNWLWCETWCDDESLKTAKTIDLCNNPMTKEPKLDRAKRQIPEWSVYDNEVAELLAANTLVPRKKDEL
ncbi:hypothetical protein HDU93_003244 [Gonapodya sp. JEL0774]|nr:hypothetical protein HDU93_003244 [Gonapodya sp. JEL0774]